MAVEILIKKNSDVYEIVVRQPFMLFWLKTKKKATAKDLAAARRKADQLSKWHTRIGIRSNVRDMTEN